MYQFKQLAVPDFMNRKAPPNYIAGLGRGATGFTTRSDIGPARDSTDDAAFAQAQAAAQGIAPPKPKGDENEDGGDDDQFQDPDNETGLFNTAPYEADDEEADRIYENIEKKLDERRKARREAREKEELERMLKERPTIQQQFSDLKRGLEVMSEDDWAAIPEVGNLVHRRGKKQKDSSREMYSAVPDSILLSAASKSSYVTSLDVTGSETPASNADGALTDFSKFGQARDKVLGLKLDQISDSVSGQTTIDPKGYLTDLSSVVVKTDAEISDIKKARTLLRSVISTNPKHAPGWIAAARLEEVAGKSAAAREIIEQGCEQCANNEDIWLEAVRLNTTDVAKKILAKAVRHVPQSVKVWMRAKELETDPKLQKQVLRRALEFIPNSVKLWKAAVSLEEDPEDARILLSRAVQCVPLSIDLWLALARLETYDNAKVVLNKARKAIPTSHEIWVTAAKLEETNGNDAQVEKIINRAVSDLAQKGSSLTREQWIKEAEQCEREEFVIVCQAIIRASIGLDVEEEDRKPVWMEDAETCVAHGSIATARAIYAHAILTFPHKKSIWRRAAFFEKDHGTPQSLEELLQRAVKYVPQAEVLWLMGAKEKWIAGDIQSAKGILEQAFAANPNSEQIWLAAIKLEVETGEYQRARLLLASARKKADTERVWMKSAVLERHQKNFPQALELLDQALVKFPKFFKLWLIKGQIQDEDLNDLESARKTYQQALKEVPNSTPLWVHASRIEEKAGLPIKARALLEKARLLNSKVPELWLEAVRVEVRSKNDNMAKALLAKALQECSQSGLLWSQAILMESRPQRKARSADAFKKCENDVMVITTIARLFWAERKIDKARNWFRRAVKADPDYGDAWAWWLKFELLQAGPDDSNNTFQDEVIKGCVAAEPSHGEEWIRVSKNMANVAMKTENILKLVASHLVNSI